MLIDDIIIEVNAGKGGDGIVAWEKAKYALGPAGGRGGEGGDVWVEATSNIGELSRYRHKRSFQAENGQNGGQQRSIGSNGKDLTLYVPVGTVIQNTEKQIFYDMQKVGQRVKVASGGRGGRGNFEFRSSRNTSPRQCEHGTSGAHARLRLELKLIADVGFVGFPNAGKSSMLNMLTAAKSKVANYPFTTLEPNLGTYYLLILADIPGLIEGASSGKGLGIKFLRHIERTRILFHFISCESSTPVKDYTTIRKELRKHNPSLLDKKEYVLLSKTDLVTSKEVEKKLRALRKKNIDTIPVCIIDDNSLDEVKKILNEIERERTIPTQQVGESVQGGELK